MTVGNPSLVPFAMSAAFVGLSSIHMVSRINLLTGDVLILLHSTIVYHMLLIWFFGFTPLQLGQKRLELTNTNAFAE
jgi:hypothetical protein